MVEVLIIHEDKLSDCSSVAKTHTNVHNTTTLVYIAANHEVVLQSLNYHGTT
jgi:hypothetical protein